MHEKHVPDREHCQELDRLCKEKNITLPETEFYWVEATISGEWYLASNADNHYSPATKGFFPAPLVSEQGEWLGKVSGKDFLNSYLEVMDLFIFQIDKVQMSHNLMTDPDIGISMLNYLIAEGIITKL